MSNDEHMTRRDLFRTAAIGGIATAVGVHGGPSGPRAAAAAAPTTPDEALAELRAGNLRFVQSIGGTNHMISFSEDLELIRTHTENAQFPFATLLSCADSRVPPEIVFDQSIGELFVCRVAGNIATPEIIASLEYSVAALNPPVRVIMVLGHQNCGAVEAAGAVTSVPGTQISVLYAPLRPAIVLGGTTLDERIRANAKIQAITLRESSPVLKERVGNGTLKIVPAYYNLLTGVVTEL